MNNNEREMWKRAYVLYEKYQDMPLTAEGFSRLTDDLGKTSQEFDNHPLIQGLLLAIFDYQDSKFQRWNNEDQ